MSSENSYKVFYSSRDASGEMWCPDCRVVESKVASIFNSADGPEAEIIYTGQRAEWKDPNNKYRHAPWNVTSVPTILKFRDGEEVARIQDDGILDAGRMEKFLKE